MKRLFFVVTVISLGYTNTWSQNVDPANSDETGLVWYTDLMEVHAISKASNKPIFAFFTGSDWCGWCKKLQKDVFAKQEFIDWAKKNVVLLELDFPKRKQLDPALANQNANLQQAFRVTGYPTIWIFNTEVDETTKNVNLIARGSLGYPSGAEVGKEDVKFLEGANMILANTTAPTEGN